MPLLETGVVCVGNWDFAIQRFHLIIKHSMEQTYESNRIITFNFVENATKNSKSFCQWFLADVVNTGPDPDPEIILSSAN